MQEVPGPPESAVVRVAGLVRSARAVAALSQRALARRAGLSKGVVARMEQDWTGQATTVRAFAQALRACGLTIDVTRGERDQESGR